jgi:hypothetical protein
MIYRFLLILSLSLVACSPAAVGSLGNPIRASIGEVAKIESNSLNYMATFGPIGAISPDVVRAALNPSTDFSNPFVGQQYKVDVNWFRIGKVIAEEGIEVELKRQTAIREVTAVQARTFSTINKVDLLFAVKVNSIVALGTTLIRIELTALNSNTVLGIVLLPIEVILPAAK